MGDNSRKRSFLEILQYLDENRPRAPANISERHQNRPSAPVRGRPLANRFKVVRPLNTPAASTSSTPAASTSSTPAASTSSTPRAYIAPNVSMPAGLTEEQITNIASVVAAQVMMQLGQQPISGVGETSTPINNQARGIQRAIETTVTPLTNVVVERHQRLHRRKDLFAMYDPSPKKEPLRTFKKTIVAYDQQIVQKLPLFLEQDLQETGFGRSTIEFDVNNTCVANYLAVKQHPAYFGYHNYDGPLRMCVAKSHGKSSPLVALKWPFPEGRILKQISGIIYVMPDVNNEDGSPNYEFIIGDSSVVRPQEEKIALPIPQVMDRCSTCDEFFSFDEIDTHQCFPDREKEGGLDDNQSLTCPNCDLEYAVGPGEKGHECSYQGLDDDTIPVVDNEEINRDYCVALMTSFTENVMKSTKEEAYREPEVHGNVFLPMQRDHWLDGFVAVVKDPALLTRIRYPAVFIIDGEPAIDSGGVTNEVVSLALNSTSAELDTLMKHYQHSEETSWRLQATGLICAIGGIQCGYLEPFYFEWTMKLKGRTAHPFIVGMDLLGFAKFLWENEPVGKLFKSRMLTAKEFLALLNRNKNPRPESEILEQCGMEHFASFLSSVEKGRVLMDEGDGSIKATVNDVYQYCTGSRFVPLDTLKSGREGAERYRIEVAFVTGRDPEEAVIPSAATCVPRLTLPLTSKMKFKKSWQIALNNRIGFGNCEMSMTCVWDGNHF